MASKRSCRPLLITRFSPLLAADEAGNAGRVQATSILLSPCSNARGRRDKPGDDRETSFEKLEIRCRLQLTPSQPEHVEHRCVALFLEFQRIGQGALAERARARGDRDILLAIELEAHGRRREAGSEIDLPQRLERDVVESCHGAVEQTEKYQTATGRNRA